MSEGPPDLVGLDTEAAVEAVLAEDADRDPETVRSVLDHVTEDGVVTEAAVDGTLSDVSLVVATVENRVDNATEKLSAARETAEGFRDLDTVAWRLEGLEDRFVEGERRTGRLGEELRRTVDRREDVGVYEFTVALRELTREAQSVQRFVDDVAMDAEDLGRWVRQAWVRFDELAGDVGALEGFVDDVETSVGAVAAAVDGDGDGDPGEDPRATDPPGVWFDATLRHRVTGPLLADLRAELADARAVSERREEDPDSDPHVDIGPDALAARLDDVDARRAAVGDDLAALARPEWRDRYGERVAAFESTLSGVEPPVDWGEVLDDLETHRPDGVAPESTTPD